MTKKETEISPTYTASELKGVDVDSFRVIKANECYYAMDKNYLWINDHGFKGIDLSSLQCPQDKKGRYVRWSRYILDKNGVYYVDDSYNLIEVTRDTAHFRVIDSSYPFTRWGVDLKYVYFDGRKIDSVTPYSIVFYDDNLLLYDKITHSLYRTSCGDKLDLDLTKLAVYKYYIKRIESATVIINGQKYKNREYIQVIFVYSDGKKVYDPYKCIQYTDGKLGEKLRMLL